jgi:rubredoxin-NAD+ reductase
MSALEAWREYLCKACGYVYNERDGDVDSGLAPGTRFEDIPEDWYCPICGVTKADFILVEETRVGVLSPSSSSSPSLPRDHSSSHRSSKRKYDVVIVGGGTAAWKIAEVLRATSQEISIAIVSQCEADRYDKPLLSVALARNLSLPELVKETGAAAALRLRIALFSNTTAIGIDPSHQVLRTTLGTIHYQHLVIAQGAQSVLPAHLPAEHCWRINHLNQYVRFRDALGSSPRRVLVIGAGLIGSELTNDLALAGHHVVLVDIAPSPLARLLPQTEQVEALLKAWEPLPIDFLGNTEVLEVKRASVKGYDVLLSHDRCLTIDEIVVATGLKTCDRLANSAALAWDNGIVVDPTTLVTSAAGIYALGDCISFAGETSRFIEPIGRQARTIASQISGEGLIPYQSQRIPVRIKTTSFPITINDD